MVDVRILTYKDDHKPQLYACGKCSQVYSPRIYAASDEISHATAREAAENCCEPKYCKECGVEVEKYRVRCTSCLEELVLGNATLTDYAECEDVVYVNGFDSFDGDMGEGYFYDIDSYLQHCEDEGIEPVEFVFATTTSHIHIDIDRILEGACEELYGDAINDVVGQEALYEAIKAFNEAQTAISYHCDVTRKIRVPRHNLEYSS